MLIAAAALSACASLTAEAPLFSTADQIGPPPLTEGIWIFVNEDCPVRNVRRVGRFPRQCSPIELRRTEDGAWRLTFREDLAINPPRSDDENMDGPFRVIIAPATEHPTADAYAPLYVAEIVQPEEGRGTGYAVIAPISAMPATEFLAIGQIDCAVILRDGPIEGVTPHYTVRTTELRPDAAPADDVAQTEEVLSGCTASSQSAVREAARRAVIESLDSLYETRFVWARPR
jgi:hypothetical protein